MDIYEFIMGSLDILGMVLGVLIVLRGVTRYKDWRAGEKLELWNFLSLVLAGAGLLLLALSCIPIVNNFYGYDWWAYLGFAVPFSLVLMLVGVALTTYYLFLKWREA
jgi:hypothetical protein